MALSRTIPLWDYSYQPPAGWLITPAPLRWPAKPAIALLDYALDATALLAGLTDTLALVVNGVTGVVCVGAGVQGGLAILWLMGGSSGADASVDLTLTTGSTRRVHRIVHLGIT
jgi:hypothetical protein